MTIEDLKKHCIKTIKMSEAIKSIPNVRVTDNRSLQEHKMVLKLIEAWEKVKEEINNIDCPYSSNPYKASKVKEEALRIIDKHLKEVSK